MKPSEKFVPIYMLFQNNKMFQRVVIVFPWDYQTYCKLWPRKDRVTEEQNPTFSKIFFFFSLNWSYYKTKENVLSQYHWIHFLTCFTYRHRIGISHIGCFIKDCIFFPFKFLWLQYPKRKYKASNFCFIVYRR